MKETVFVHIIDFPQDTKAKEAVTLNEDGSYSVFINARLNDEQQLEAYKHALEHIENDDFHSEESVQCIEAQRHHLTEEKPPERKKRRSKHDAYLRKRARREKELAKLGLKFETVLVDDDYGAPRARTQVLPIEKY